MGNKRRSSKRGRQSPAQAAVEYLTTYGWAIIIVAVVIVVLYIFVLAPTSIAPQSCSVTSGAYCSDILFGSNGTITKAIIIFTNSQQYPVSNPGLTVDIQNRGNVSATCSPEYVLPGGTILCVATLSTGYSQGSYISGQLYLKSKTCVTGENASSCSGSSQTYSGMLNAHTQPILSANTVSVALSVANRTQTADGAPDMLVATVRLLGYPYEGASVIFSSNQSFAPVTPYQVTSDASGNADSFVSSTITGNAVVTAAFGGYSANVTVSFAPPIYITLSSNVTACPTCIVAVLDGKAYTQTQVNTPLTIPVGYGSRQVYAYSGTVTNSAGNTRDIIVSVSGCGDTGQNNTFIATYNCTVNATYQLQYLLTEYASDPDGSVSPGTSWINAQAPVSIATTAYTPPSLTQYIWEGWSGTGTGSSSSSSMSSSITMSGPITEVAQYLTQYYVTMSTYPSGGGYTTVDGSSPGSGWYDRASYHTIAAYAYSGYTFDSWSGASGGSSTTIQVNNPMSITAIFDVCITATDNGGGYEAGTGCYSYGGSAYITANPDSGYEWDSWSDGGGQDHYVSVYSPTTYTATYSLIPTTTMNYSNSSNSTTTISGGSTVPCVNFYAEINGYSSSSQWPPGVAAENGAHQSYACYTPGSNVNLVATLQGGSKYQFEQWTCSGNAGGTCYSGYSQNPAPAFTIESDTVETAYIYPEIYVSPCVGGDSYEITSGSHAGQYFTCTGPGTATDGSGNQYDYFAPGSAINLRATGGSGSFAGWAALNDSGDAISISCSKTVNNAFNLETYTEVRAYWCSTSSPNCYPC